MAAFLEAAKLFLSLLPLVVNVVREVEKLFPGSGAGGGKLQIVMSALEASAEFAAKTADEINALRPVLTRVVNSAVSVLNQLKAW